MVPHLAKLAGPTLGLLMVLSGGAWAGGMHDHPDANGMADAPLDIVRAADDLPGPIGVRPPRTVSVDLETVEVTGRLADNTAYHYWTFGARVPGPFVRARVGDTINVTLTNRADSSEKHSVDFHAATAPGGGHFATEAAPGESRSFSFKALKPGLYVYHCAVPEAAVHIANGMYGLILVEPEEPLPPVDREFYVVQGEVYTEQAFGTEGLAEFDATKMGAEQPEYYVFNGAVGALVNDGALAAKVGETVRIYFGVGGPSKNSSFHVIGEIFDRAYQLASLSSPPLLDVQTISVPPGGATVVDIGLEVPGEYTLVDHALARARRGLVGKLIVSD
ncbi:MAG: multicopper oxidase domain-containing protein [Devosia nanyangense]|uniref:Copper-containing nitrite reductase n=1 Tax=Devosia nanyangense TaxID=1228055 RepID=A0A933KYJ4_9HYPH|nr:multicopper oxidase domain-containing protein [Devosia nanyangense]